MGFERFADVSNEPKGRSNTQKSVVAVCITAVERAGFRVGRGGRLVARPGSLPKPRGGPRGSPAARLALGCSDPGGLGTRTSKGTRENPTLIVGASSRVMTARSTALGCPAIRSSPGPAGIILLASPAEGLRSRRQPSISGRTLPQGAAVSPGYPPGAGPRAHLWRPPTGRGRWGVGGVVPPPGGAGRTRPPASPAERPTRSRSGPILPARALRQTPASGTAERDFPAQPGVARLGEVSTD